MASAVTSFGIRPLIDTSEPSSDLVFTERRYNSSSVSDSISDSVSSSVSVSSVISVSDSVSVSLVITVSDSDAVSGGASL
jgi:hypothetical protein